MTEAPGIRDRHEAYFKAFTASGIDALDEAARRELALRMVHEARKGAFNLQAVSDEALLASFMDHFRKEFIDDPDVTVVLDYSWGIRERARDLSAAGHLVEPIILYATWVEHWLNGVLLTRALALGLTHDEAQSLLRDATLKAKQTWILRLLGLPPLQAEDVTTMKQLSDTRNQYVHYKWTPRPPEAVDQIDPDLARVLSGTEPLCRRLVDYEIANVSEPALQVAERVFGVALRDALRLQ